MVDANRDCDIDDATSDAIAGMRLGTSRYDLGPDAPLPPYAKARVLGNLNVMYGMRQASHHDMRRRGGDMASGSAVCGAICRTG